MWVLWFVLAINGMALHTPLEHYGSKSDCEEAGIQIYAVMKATYPDDRTLQFYCTEVAWPIKKVGG